MHETKFRVWDKFQKRYIVEGFHVMGEITAMGGIESHIAETWIERKKAMGHECTLDAWDDFICEQFTGLKDKNGKDLYAEDIFKDERNYIYRCYSVVGGFAHSLPQFPSTLRTETAWPLQPLADAQTGSWFESNCIIVGNIHETPDLILIN